MTYRNPYGDDNPHKTDYVAELIKQVDYAPQSCDDSDSSFAIEECRSKNNYSRHHNTVGEEVIYVKRVRMWTSSRLGRVRGIGN